MKKKLNKVTGAETVESRLSEIMPMLEDDFDYFMSGLDKLDRSGKDLSDSGYDIAQEFYEMLQEAISKVSDIF